ncbi:MAG: polysaccharide deacetylase family protein, partial [Pseudomonadota bacterium]
LTFDDGPSKKYTPQVLDTLLAHDVQATFFINGDPASAAPDVLARMVADGHELGNHAYWHDRLVLIRPSTVRDHLFYTDQVIRAAGHQGPIHFRPPYGAKWLSLPWVLSRQDRLTVTWDVAPEAPDRAMAADIAAFAVDQARPGSIIVLHPNWSGNDQTRAALPAIIDGLRAKGLEPVTLARLLEMRLR